MAASIVDALVVTLGLDNRQFLRAERETRESSTRTREHLGRNAREVEASGKRASSYLRGIRNEVLGLFLAFAGANTIKDFATQILAGDAATGRLATNLGLATEELSAWEGAIKRVGGQAADADNALRAMTSAFQTYQLTGTTGHDADFQGLGVGLSDLQNPANALLKMAEAGERMSRPEFVARLQRIGIPEATIVLLQRGRKELEGLLEEQRRLGVVTERDAQAAQLLQDRLGKLSAVITGAARPQLTALAEAALNFADNTNAGAWIVPVFTGVLGAAALAAVAAYWPIIALGGALAVLVKGFGDAEAAGRRWANTQQAWEDLKAGNVRSALRRLGDNAANLVGGDAPGGGRGGWMQEARDSVGRYASGMGGGGRDDAAIMSYLRQSGFSDAQARGIHAGIVAEGGTPTARNPTSGAFGLGQWLGPRQRELFRRYGRNPSQQQQMEFLVWELQGGDAGGPSVGRQSSADDTLVAYIRNFMRPAAGAETTGDLARGRAVLGGRAPVGMAARGGGGGTTTQTTSVGAITIYTAATDANGIASDLRGALAKRGLVVQANSGMQP